MELRLKKKNIWNEFLKFEELRNEIIHQKTINSTDFYKKYFEENIFYLCEIPEKLIKHFYNNRENKSITNPLWPWIVNEKNKVPISYEYNSEYFELSGNIFEEN